MAQLLSYYRLCPLIDTKSLLGISNDFEKGVVIVTLGRNIAIKYRLSDQKQICSWRTKDKFSSPVVYDITQQKYVAVFNKSFIRFWSDEDENLDKVKKVKFNQQIYSILIHDNELFIFFKDGSIYPLKEIIDQRKTFIPEKVIKNEEIYDFIYSSSKNDLCFGFLTKSEDCFKFYWSKYMRNLKNVFNTINLQRDQLSLSGYGLHLEESVVNFLTIWSDGRIYNQVLSDDGKPPTNPGELFAVIENISAKHLIKLVDIDDNYIAIYGADPCEEGAMLLIYNTQFKVVQSKQLHKLYTNDSKIWRIDDYILLPVGQNLIVVPFQLDSEQLAALVGSHKPLNNKIDADFMLVTEIEVGKWESKEKNTFKQIGAKNVFSELQQKVEDHLKQGLPESLIVEQFLPEVLEKNKIQLLEESLSFFTDIPEKIVAKILKYLLSCPRKYFNKLSKSPNLNNFSQLLSAPKINLLDKILVRPYSDILLLPHLRSELSVDESLLMLKYLIYMLSEDSHNLPSLNAIETEECIINWSCLIIDSNYQKFVLSKDESIQQTLLEYQKVVLGHLEVLEELKKVSPSLNKLEQEIKGMNFNGRGFMNSLYSVEQISIY